MTEIQSLILCWFEENHRKLPWRQTKDPYFIWLSEVILQQTRVAQGTNYYFKFIKNYPTITHLAKASEQEVLSDWQGLGYYSRARNLHASAKYINENLNGIFPKSYDEIIKLKGIGEYTAAAISSFAFNEARAVVDGNVYRVLSRLFDIDTPIDTNDGKKLFQKIANELLNVKNPGLHNQAMMEFGALQCIPSNPDCSICPLVMYCNSNRNNSISERPVKQSKTKIRNRYFLYFVDLNNQKIILRKKTEKDIWQNLYEFPKKEFESKRELQNYISENKYEFNHIIEYSKHILSHQHLHATFAFVWNSQTSNKFVDTITINWIELDQYPIPRLIDRFIQEHPQLFQTHT
jgi:A/G-specific adenine glycosylase